MKKADNSKWAVKVIEKVKDPKKSDKQKTVVDNEIDCWARLEHPHIVLLKEVFETPTHYNIVQELYQIFYKHWFNSFTESLEVSH